MEEDADESRGKSEPLRPVTPKNGEVFGSGFFPAVFF